MKTPKFTKGFWPLMVQIIVGVVTVAISVSLKAAVVFSAASCVFAVGVVVIVTAIDKGCETVNAPEREAGKLARWDSEGFPT